MARRHRFRARHRPQQVLEPQVHVAKPRQEMQYRLVQPQPAEVSMGGRPRARSGASAERTCRQARSNARRARWPAPNPARPSTVARAVRLPALRGDGLSISAPAASRTRSRSKPVSAKVLPRMSIAVGKARAERRPRPRPARAAFNRRPRAAASGARIQRPARAGSRRPSRDTVRRVHVITTRWLRNVGAWAARRTGR